MVCRIIKRKGEAMEKDRKPPENNPPSKKGVEVMEQLVKERKEEKLD